MLKRSDSVGLMSGRPMAHESVLPRYSLHMETYETTTTWTDLAERVRNAGSLLVVTHRKPDGDAMGSCLAIARALPQDVAIHLVGPITPTLRTLAGDTPFTDSEKDPTGEPDLIILVDTGAWVQVGPLSEWLKARRDRIIGMDHHPVGNDIAPDRIIDTSCASATMMVLRLLDELGIDIDGDGVGEALFTGLATDTGWFRHSNADSAAFKMASRLIKSGVDRDRMYRLLEEEGTPGKLSLLARALSSMEFVFDGACVIMQLTDDDFAETGAKRVEVEGLVNQPLSISTVRASFLLYAEEDGATKSSLRSKPPTGDFEPIDVSELAVQLGGGGHVRASGARIAQDLPVARAKLMEALSAAAGA